MNIEFDKQELLDLYIGNVNGKPKYSVPVIKMKTKNTIKLTDDVIPAFAIHPGEHIKDEIEARELNQKDFARKMGVSIDTLNQLFKGNRDITIELAQNLENALGIKAEFWLNLQMDFEIDTIRIKHRDIISKTKNLNKRKYKIKETVI